MNELEQHAHYLAHQLGLLADRREFLVHNSTLVALMRAGYAEYKGGRTWLTYKGNRVLGQARRFIEAEWQDGDE